MVWRSNCIFLTFEANIVLTVGLVQNIPKAIPRDERPIEDPFWDEDPLLDTFSGWVALDSEYIREHNLLTSMRWPWDHNKHIYVLHAYHSLHCVVSEPSSKHRFNPLLFHDMTDFVCLTEGSSHPHYGTHSQKGNNLGG